MKKDPSGIDRLVLLNTIIYEEGFKPPMRFETGWFSKLYTSLYKASLSHRMMINATLNNGLGKGANLSATDKKGYWIPMREGANEALYYFFTQTCNKLPDYYGDLLEQLDQPAMVIWGAKDPMLKWAPQAEKVIEDLEIKTDDVHVLPEARHFIQEEAPEDIARWIAEFAKR